MQYLSWYLTVVTLDMTTSTLETEYQKLRATEELEQSDEYLALVTFSPPGALPAREQIGKLMRKIEGKKDLQAILRDLKERSSQKLIHGS